MGIDARDLYSLDVLCENGCGNPAVPSTTMSTATR